jgi:hypothetical protein
MVWVRLDDGFADHPKVVRVGDAGLAMFVRGLCYCNRHLTDGEIPFEAAKHMGHHRTAKALVDAGLWIVKGTCFVAHDFDKFNPTRESVLQERKAAQDRKNRWVERQKERRRNGVPNGGKNGDGTVPPPPYPPPTPALLRSARGKGGRDALAPDGAAPAQGGEENPQRREALRLAELCGVHERHASDLIDKHGAETIISAAKMAQHKGPDAQSYLLDLIRPVY